MTSEGYLAAWRGPATWLRSSRVGPLVGALLVGIGAGAGAILFRYLIFAFTWIFTGHKTYGQQGLMASPHLPGIGWWFLLLVPAVGGLMYGPLIYFFAKEARGHGVPEVMAAVAEQGGRIRPRVTIVKALASALCIGTGGSVGREGPIVQIGSALASTFGQLIQVSESRMRLLVACGAAGAISATFNAPLAGAFFSLELVLRELSTEEVVSVVISSMAADAIGRSVFGSHPFFALPPLTLNSGTDYVLCAVLGLSAGLVGVAFQKCLYWTEDLWDRLWKGRPEWARPAVGGLVLGLLLLALPQLYGVGYPVLQHAITSGYVLWFLAALAAGKIVACSLTIGMGGSGGVFGPSLFVGTMLGTAYGDAARTALGSDVGAAGAFGMVGMGAVFAGAARAPLTAVAATLEMTGDTQLVLPAMLAVGVATVVSQQLSYGTIYTTKLLRRGIDIERSRPATSVQRLGVGGVIRQLLPRHDPLPSMQESPVSAQSADSTPGAEPQSFSAEETLEPALQQPYSSDPSSLPEIAEDGEQ
ncbi:MAG: chloride channel protein [Candidatus Dormibacteria bacterium]